MLVNYGVQVFDSRKRSESENAEKRRIISSRRWDVLLLHPRHRTYAAWLMCIALAVCIMHAPPLHAEENTSKERVAILTFWAFDQQGNIVPRASETDLARLSAVLPQGIAAKLVQSGAFEVIDESLLAAYNSLPAVGEHELARVEELFDNDLADQVIIGTVAQIQQSVVTNVRRYVPGPDGPLLEGAAVVRSNNASEAVNAIENLLSQIFPPDTEVVQRPISRIVVIPNVLRIPVGGTAPIQAYAIDDLGRTITTVSFIFDTDDETRVLVDDHGQVTGISPGRAQISLQPLGRPLAPNVTVPRVEVTVVGPSLGLRAGMSTGSNAPSRPRIGLRLSPNHEIRTSTPTQPLPQAGSNPVNVLTSFFGSLLGNQMLTVDLDIVPSHDLSMTLNAVQRTPRSYFGTGIGVAVPLADDGPSGVILRLTLGGQLPMNLRSNLTWPVEVNADFILGGTNSAPQARVSVSFGLDLFQ